MALIAGEGGGRIQKKPRTYKDWSAASANDKKLIDLAKKLGRNIKGSGDRPYYPPYPVKRPGGAMGVGGVVVKKPTKGKANSSNPRSPNQVDKGKGYTGPTMTRKPTRPVGSVAGAAAGKAAGKAIPKKSTMPGAGKPVAPKAPLVGGGGVSPAINPTVAGGGGKPGPSAAAQKAVEQNKTAVNNMQKFIDQAKASISAQDLPALNELDRQLKNIQETYGKQKGETEQRGQAMQSDLAELFGRLGNFTRQVKSHTDQEFQALQQQGGQHYAALQGQLGQTFGKAKSDTEAELARMGMSGQAPNATADITRDQAYLQGLAGADGAHLKGAFGLQQGGFDQLMGMAQNNAATEGTVQVGRARRDMEQTLSDLMFELNQNTRNVSGKRGDILATQGQRTNELAMLLEDKNYSRNFAAEEAAFARKIALERLGMEKEQHALGMQPGANDPGIDDLLRTQKLKMEVEGMMEETEYQKKLREWQAAVAASGLPGKRTF